MLRLAFEGINGGGKSRLITNLRAALEQRSGNCIHVAKCAGFGDSRRFGRLREILTSREQRRLRGALTDQELLDYHRDRIFRIAYRFLGRRIHSVDTNGLTHLLLDRTPLMSWAYTRATYPESPCMEEVREEALKSTRLLDIDRVYVLQVEPATVYGRLLARHTRARCDPQKLDAVLAQVRAPRSVLDAARQIARSMLEDPLCTAKPFSLWDYMPYPEVVQQLQTYPEVVAAGAKLIGFDWDIIDANRPVPDVVANVLATLDESA